MAQQTEGSSSRSAKSEAIRSIPWNRISKQAQKALRPVVERPSFYRRMPTQQVECDPEMFRFLVRRPEVMVNIWQITGITKVTAQRLNPYSFNANDGVGTACRCDLVYSADDFHIYLGEGDYDGSMAPRRVTGNCVCILRTRNARNDNGDTVVRGTMDVFLKLDNFGADLLAKSVAPFVGKTADYNFVETAKFIGQISNVCVRSPSGAQNLAARLTTIQPNVQREFAKIAANIASERLNAMYNSARLAEDNERLKRLTLGQDQNRKDGPSAEISRAYTPKWQSDDRSQGKRPPPYPTGPPTTPIASSSQQNYVGRSPAPSMIPLQSNETAARTPDVQLSDTLTLSDGRNDPSTRRPPLDTSGSAESSNSAQSSSLASPSWIAPRKQNIFMRR